MRILTALIALAGIASAEPAFDVASVKPNASDTGVSRIKIGSGNVIIENVSLRRLIGMAYGIPDTRQYLLSGPDWLESEHFDMSAKYDPTIKDDGVPPMLLTLLTERFRLAAHRETRQIPATRWRSARTGQNSNLPPARSQAFKLWQAMPKALPFRCRILADRLSRATFQLDRPVVDFTGLTGRYDLTLDWVPTDPIFSALEEQLGLKLEARKMPLEILIVDHADKVPAAN